MKKVAAPGKDISRRDFVKGAALSAAGFMIVPRHVLGGKDFTAPSDQVSLGIIGAGGKGRQNVEDFMVLPNVRITALSDPSNYWNLADFYYKSEAGRGPVIELLEDHYAQQNITAKIGEYIDFREMMEKEKGLDGIICSTPDHTHAYISLMALKAGKHVYCEKPLTHNIWEAREVAKVAKESGLATQMGNPGHSTDGIRETVEYLRAGVIGKVTEAYAWVPAGRWLSGLQGLPQGKTTLPVGFDWDQWIGPREKVDFHKDYVPVTWRDFWAYGCGALGDFGCHDLDAATWAFNLKAPESVQIFPAGFSNSEIAPYGEIGYYHFAEKGDQKALKLTWYSGGLTPDLHPMLPRGYTYPRRGSMFVGEKGVIINDGGNRTPQVFPENVRNNIKAPKPTLERSKGHYSDWIEAIKTGKPASSNFEYGARLTELTLLGVLSLRLGGKRIEWDYENMKAKGMPEADQYIRESVRPGWEM
ncbi:Gfo/Idh/MocA family protein [Rhodonellum sp.]|uniref:Gfo/Idh/MocA family protein n=1 Tax=Rhodonellum sp. TaxID=2231180 RepID=UPI0027188F11|nr:Gfo/Idh/MocA family oxidoreductase [Rhodonellum sp.]MDO9554092.1 Gfo/Idh/MocA family oxidoreductase [Rhodonellum sp.]